MAEAPHGISLSIPIAGDPLPSAQNEASGRGASGFSDGSGQIFSMYLEQAKHVDKDMAESWKEDADGILIFTGLFSAAVASLISVSVQDLRPGSRSQDTSNFYLANIYQAITDPNRSDIPTPSSPPPFTPPTYAVWVNSLWFLSLVISITCALLATLLQQWARKYLKATQPTSNLHRRARIRAFFHEGVENSFLPFAVEALPTMLHLSLFMFFCGLAVFLWNVNLTVFKLALSWVGCCTALYGCATLIPIFRHNSPYHTPLTPLAGHVVTAILHVLRALCSGFHQLLGCCFCCRPGGLTLCCPARLRGIDLRDRLQKVLDIASMTPEKLKEDADLPSPMFPNDMRAFMWTFNRLDEDHQLERFFSGIPGFRNSDMVKDHLDSPTLDDMETLYNKLIKFIGLTFSSDLLPDHVKSQRAIMCAEVIDLAGLTRDEFSGTVLPASYLEQHATNSSPIASNSGDENAVFIQAIRTAMVARPQHRDDSWFRRHAPKALGISEGVLRDYAKDDSLSLAIFIYATRQQFTNFHFPSWPSEEFWTVLDRLSKFDVFNTSPKLQHDFCALWNEIVLKAQTVDPGMAWRVLRYIRNVYVTLHQHTCSTPKGFTATTDDWDEVLRDPFSYPKCDVTSHLSDVSASTRLARAVLATASPDAPSSSVPAPSRVDESLTTVPPLSDSRPTLRTFGTSHVPVTSLIPAPASRDVVFTSGIPTPLHTPQTSTSARPRFVVSPPAAVSLQNNAHLLTPSDSPPVLDNILPAESYHRPIIDTTAPSASPGPAFATDLGSAIEDDNTDTMATQDVPQYPPAARSVTDSNEANLSSLLQGAPAERTGDHPPNPSRTQYDMV